MPSERRWAMGKIGKGRAPLDPIWRENTDVRSGLWAKPWMAEAKGPSARAVGQEGEPKEPDVSRVNQRGEKTFGVICQRVGLSKVTRPGPKGGRNPVEGCALVFHAAKPHQGANRWLGNPARVCRRGTDYCLRCNALCLLHPTVFHCVAKPRHHINSANVRIRCVIRTYDSITLGDYGFPHPLPRGEGTKTLGAATSRK